MSVERVERKDGSVVWRVRWRQGGRNRSKVLGRKRDAEAFEAELVRRRRTGELAQLDAGKEPLAEFGEEWWRLHARAEPGPIDLEVYAVLWDAHVLPRLGSISLRELTPDVHQPLPARARGRRRRPASVRKTLVLLQGVLQRACEWGRIPANPASVGAQAVGRRARLGGAAGARARGGDPRSLLERGDCATRRSSPCSHMPGCGRARRWR